MSNYARHLTLTPPEGDSGQPKAGGEDGWRSSLRGSDVVMQWDPDHQPFTGHRMNYKWVVVSFEILAYLKGGERDCKGVTGRNSSCVSLPGVTPSTMYWCDNVSSGDSVEGQMAAVNLSKGDRYFRESYIALHVLGLVGNLIA